MQTGVLLLALLAVLPLSNPFRVPVATRTVRGESF